MLYHVSPNAGLKTLYPRVSSHKKAYVYAIENFVTGLLFGVKMDDFDISTNENGFPTVYECYPDAFKNIYQGKNCSVYVVDDEGFKRGLTSWSKEEALGDIKICRYEFNNDYRKKISAHVVDRLIRFDVDLQHCLEQDVRFAAHYRRIIEGLHNVMDGHLLQ